MAPTIFFVIWYYLAFTSEPGLTMEIIDVLIWTFIVVLICIDAWIFISIAYDRYIEHKSREENEYKRRLEFERAQAMKLHAVATGEDIIQEPKPVTIPRELFGITDDEEADG
jgi:hypothetical protein